MSFTKTYAQRLALRRRTNNYALYYLIENETGDVVYVGATCNPTRRRKEHKCASREMRLKVVCVVQGKEEASRVEKELIEMQRLRGAYLLNETLPAGGRESLSFQPLEALLRPRSTDQEKVARREVKRMIREGARMSEVYK